MGQCCPPDDSDTNPEQTQQNGTKRKPKPTGEVNPFKPGGRDVRITQDEDGRLTMEKYNPPSDPDAYENRGEAMSLVTHSLMNAQKKDIDTRESKMVD